MKNILTLLTFAVALLLTNTSISQNITVKVKGLQDTTIHLAKYYGSKLYFADTTEFKNGKATFDASKQKPGILAVVLPGQKYFELIYNNEDIAIETKLPDFIEHLKVKKSKENQVFYNYINFMKTSQEDAQNIREELQQTTDEKRKEQLEKQLQSTSDRVKSTQANMVAENEGTLASKIIKMSMEVEVPEAPKDENGNLIDSNFRYNYFRDNYFNNIDLKDDRLVNTPVFQRKFEYFYSKEMLLQHPDTIFKYLSRVMDQVPEGTDMYRFVSTNAATTLEKSKIMGMDRAFNLIIDRYFCAKDEDGEPKGFWVSDEKLETLCDDTKKRLRLVQGEVPPNLILTDSTNKKWYNLHEIEADYVVLYFWDPNCGHCKKSTPKLGQLYDKKLKDRNVEVFAVGKATGDDFEDWKKFVKKHDLKFINVGVTQPIYEQASENARSLVPEFTTVESLNYQDTYNIYSSPKTWILDKNKVIIGKDLGIAQLEEYLDRIQGFEDEEKLFEVKKKDVETEILEE